MGCFGFVEKVTIILYENYNFLRALQWAKLLISDFNFFSSRLSLGVCILYNSLYMWESVIVICPIFYGTYQGEKVSCPWLHYPLFLKYRKVIFLGVVPGALHKFQGQQASYG